MALYDLQIVTPNGMRFDGKAESLVVNTSAGQIGILAGHTNYMAAVVIGKVKLTDHNKTRYAVCGNGFLSVEEGKCTLLANSFDFAEDLDPQKVETDIKDAEELLLCAVTPGDRTIAKDRLRLASLRLSILDM